MSGYEGLCVAVTGGTGYIGSALRARLAQTGAKVVVVSRGPVPTGPSETGVSTALDQVDAWQEVVRVADVIFHLGGNTSVYEAERSPADSLRTNVAPVASLIEACRAQPRRRRVVFASTATVYGLTRQIPVREDCFPRPITVYDLHKYFAEEMLFLAARRGDLEAISLRLPNVYGPSVGKSSSADRGVVTRLVRSALSGRPLTLFGDGSPLRDYVYIDDVVDAFLAAGAQPGLSGEALNVATGVGTSLLEAFHRIADGVQRMTGTSVTIETQDWPTDLHEIERRSYVGDPTRILERCGWQARVPFAEGVDRLISHWNSVG